NVAPEKSVAEAADDIWAHYGYDLGTDYSGIFKAVSHMNINVHLAAWKSDINPGSEDHGLQVNLSIYFEINNW
ncbi:hypothetical protein AALP_AAs59248U000100, partial [Arabis alpina]